MKEKMKKKIKTQDKKKMKGYKKKKKLAKEIYGVDENLNLKN